MNEKTQAQLAKELNETKKELNGIKEELQALNEFVKMFLDMYAENANK